MKRLPLIAVVIMYNVIMFVVMALNIPKILGIVRHVLTLVGGILVALGFLTEDILADGVNLVVAAIGAVLTLWGFISSFLAPEKKISNQAYQQLRSR